MRILYPSPWSTLEDGDRGGSSRGNVDEVHCTGVEFKSRNAGCRRALVGEVNLGGRDRYWSQSVWCSQAGSR